MPAFRLPRRVRAAFAPACLLVLLASGCGGGDSGIGKMYPVSGKVTYNGQPVVAKSAFIQFKPDASKGNTSPFEPMANVDEQGNYTLTTKERPGAPPGWYKVIVTAVADSTPGKVKDPTHRPVPKSLIPSKYAKEKTTISIEVVENPAAGAYDLKLTD